MNHKKPAFWIILIAIIISVVTIVCFCTDPRKKVENPDPTETNATEQTENRDTTDTTNASTGETQTNQTENTDKTDNTEKTEVYFERSEFASLVVGKSLAEDVLDAIAPKTMPPLQMLSDGMYCDFPLKEGGYIRIRFYEKDGFPVLVGSIEDVPSPANYVHKASEETIGYTSRTGKQYVIKIERAKILSFSNDAIACQKELNATYQTILAELQKLREQGSDAIFEKVGYDGFLNGNILSLVVKAEYADGNYAMCAVYNFDVSTGKRLDKQALIEKLQITGYDAKLTQAVKDAFANRYGSVTGTIADSLNATLASANLKKAELFVGLNGKPTAAVAAYTAAGAAGYYELVPLA